MAGERIYEWGLEGGLLQPKGASGAVPWEGLISVSESPSGGTPQPYYLDGYKYLNLSTSEEFEATIEAYQAPREFGPCDGSIEVANGLFAMEQPRVPFDLVYRTKIGNDVTPYLGEKIHIIYNALSAPSERTNNTVSAETEARTLSWAITTQPPMMTGMKPTAHLVIDSRYTPTTLWGDVISSLYSEGFESIAPAETYISLFKNFTES